MKVIFLDIDGVVNTWDSQANSDDNNRDHPSFPPKELLYDVLDPPSVDAVNQITDATEAKIVVSSTWRVLFEFRILKAFLKRQGIKAEVVGKTPDLVRWSRGAAASEGGILLAKQRGDEIQAWLDEHTEVEKFIILDDDADMAHLIDRLVQPRPSMETGLEQHHVDKAIEMLED